MIWRSIITRRRPKRPARQRGWPDVVPSRVSAHKWLAQRAKQEPKAVPRGAKRFCQCAFSGLQVQASKCSADFFCLWFFNPLNLQMKKKQKWDSTVASYLFDKHGCWETFWVNSFDFRKNFKSLSVSKSCRFLFVYLVAGLRRENLNKQ